MIRQFLAHTSPGKSRVFALADGAPERLEAVTSLGAADLHLTGELVRSLNNYLTDRDEVSVGSVLARLPGAVRVAVSHFLATRCASEQGLVTPSALEVVREAFFGPVDDELARYIGAAYTLGLGIRMTNLRDQDGEVAWSIQLRKEEVMLPASAETRAWALPEGVRLLRTWTDAEAEQNVVFEALAVADAAAKSGRWARLHTVFQSDSDNLEGPGSSAFVVDAFDALVPPDEEDETPESFSAQFR